jgi:hypothetical protein
MTTENSRRKRRPPDLAVTVQVAGASVWVADAIRNLALPLWGGRRGGPKARRAGGGSPNGSGVIPPTRRSRATLAHKGEGLKRRDPSIPLLHHDLDLRGLAVAHGELAPEHPSP